jgi:hypothetical protein
MPHDDQRPVRKTAPEPPSQNSQMPRRAMIRLLVAWWCCAAGIAILGLGWSRGGLVAVGLVLLLVLVGYGLLGRT